MAEIQSGINANDKATVDPTSKALRTTLYDATGVAATQLDGAQPTTASGLVVFGQNDRILLPLRTDRLGSLASALHTPLLHDSFEGATTHASRWNTFLTTMTATQSTIGGLTLNGGAITTINTGAMVQSTARFTKTQRSPMQFKARMRMIRANNATYELGFGDAASSNAAHTTGAYWQITPSGVVQPVLTFNGAESSAGATDISASIVSTNFYTFDVIMDDDEAVFICQDTATSLVVSRQSIKLPLAAQRLLSATALPVFARVFISGTAPATAPQLILSDAYLAALDADRNMPWAHVMASMQRGAAMNPFTGAALANFSNNTAPVNATLSNTAAGYTTLGGNFSFAAVAGAATDYALFGFQVPAGANFNCTGIDVETINTGAASATSPTTLQWFASENQPAVTLASNSLRSNVGMQSIPVGAAIGAKADSIKKAYQTPLVTNSGRFFVIGLRMAVGTATASQVIQGNVNLEGYFS